MFDTSEKLIVGQSDEIVGVTPINWEDSSWRQLSLVSDEEVISLSHAVEHHDFLDVPLQPFLSNRKQSAVSKRGQEGSSREGSAMAKPRPMNLVSYNLLSSKKNSLQDVSDSNRGMPWRNKAVFQLASGNRCEIRADIQPSILKRGNRKTLKVQRPGNRNREVALRTLPASGNRCKVWRHT